MMDWMQEHWFVEAVACIFIGLLLAWVITVVVEYLDMNQ